MLVNRLMSGYRYLAYRLRALCSLQCMAWAVAALAAVIYVYIYVFTPLVIMVWQNYDDSLFVKLGEYLSIGKWLGPYDQFTMMKGPGYPLFLAVSHWSGLPNTFTQAIFYCTAMGALALVILKATRSKLSALAVFALPLLDPKVFEINRTLRDCIYSSQTVLFIAIFAYCLLQAGTRRRRVASAVMSGVLFGWLWLTREEGVWLLPPIAVLVGFAIQRAGGWRCSRIWLSPSLVMVGAFALVNVGLATLNLVNYGSFVRVDFKTKSFQSALSALESVQESQRVSYVNVPRATRIQVYAVSPHFAKLRPYLDPIPGPSPWEAGECMFHKSACGDIGNGFFMWALRDAVAAVGGYRSPERASEFYDAIASEIRSACNTGRLRCEQRFIPYMPRMTPQQVGYIPGSFGTLLRDVFTAGTEPAPPIQNVTGTRAQFVSTLEFLNWPSHFPLYDNPPKMDVDVSGWFHDPSDGAEWFKLIVSDQHSKNVAYNLVREGSPDLAQGLHDPSASKQRFVLRTQCTSGCVLHFSGKTGSKDIPVTSSMRFYKRVTSLGGSLLVFDSGKVVLPPPLAKDQRVALAAKMRVGLYTLYNVLLPILLSAGVFAFLVMCFISVRNRSFTTAFVIAAVCWVGAVTRAVILVLIDVSSFPAMITPYLLPVYVLTVIASVLSLVALREAFSPVGERVLRPAVPVFEK